MTSTVPQLDGFDADRRNEADPNPRVEIDAIDVRLPCRSFRVSYKVAEPGNLSLTTEFLLRLLRAADGLTEEAIGEFFAFTDDETRFAIDHAYTFGYVERVNGRVYLTDGGHNLFSVGSDEPALFEVQNRRDRFDFDLIAFAPADPWKQLSSFEFGLPELGIASAEAVGTASARIVQAFTRHFHEFRPRRAGGRTERQSLYTVDSVEVEKRFATLVPVKVSVRPENPASPEADLLSWKTGFELDDRSAVLQSCANLVRNVRVTEESVGREAASRLLRCAPEQVSRFMRDGELDWGSFFRSTIRQAGKLQSDRATVRVVGRVWVDANSARLKVAAEYAAKRVGKRPSMILWLKPSVPLWGMTTRLPDLIAALRASFPVADESEPERIQAVIVGDDLPKCFQNIFSAAVKVPRRSLPPGLEVLLVPGRLAFVLAHSPIGVSDGYPVPMGIATFDPVVVERVHQLLTEALSVLGVAPEYCEGDTKNLLEEIDAALDSPNDQ